MIKVYMEVTQDQYQLPIAWGYSAAELPRKCGKTKLPRFIRVDIEEDDKE